MPKSLNQTTSHQTTVSIPRIRMPRSPVGSAYDKVDLELCVIQKLKILQSLRSLNVSQTTAQGNKRRVRATRPYNFEYGCFTKKNVEAGTHAIYFVLKAFDFETATAIFKDCWPCNDRKMVGEFRKAVVPWLKEIITRPELRGFFGNIKPEYIPKILLDNGGDKFIKFLDCFVIMIGSRTFERNSKLLPKGFDQLCSRPKNFGIEAVTSRQLVLLTKKILELKRKSAESMARIWKIRGEVESMVSEASNEVKQEEELKTRQRIFLAENAASVKDICEQEECLIPPELQSTALKPFEQLSEILPEEFREEFFESTRDSLLASVSVVAKWGEDLQGMMSYLDKFDTFEQLAKKEPWYEDTVLNLDRLYFANPIPTAQERTLGHFMEGLLRVGNAVVEDQRLLTPITEDTFREYEEVDLKIHSVLLTNQRIRQRMQQTTGRIDEAKKSETYKRCIEPSPRNKPDWSKLSGLNLQPFNYDCLFSTIKPSKLNHATGFTPKADNFLRNPLANFVNEDSTVNPSTSSRRLSDFYLLNQSLNPLPPSRANSDLQKTMQERFQQERHVMDDSVTAATGGLGLMDISAINLNISSDSEGNMHI